MKFMNMKRFASTVMAGVLTLSLAVPAFAADNTTEITATYQDIELAVTVPTTGTAIINPYGLPVVLDAKNGISISGEQITTGAPLLVENRSSVALSVSASVKGEKTGTFAFDANAVATTETANKGNVKFQMFPAPGVTEGYKIADFYQAFADLDDSTEGHDVAKDIVLTEHAAGTDDPSESDIIVLREGADGDLQDGGAAYFRLSGTVAKKPTTAWVAADGFKATIAFTFEPSTYTKSAGTLTAAPTSLSMAGTTQTTLTFTSQLPTGVTAEETTYASSDTDVLTVAANGATATAKAAGTATVTVTIKGSDGITYTATTGTITVTA